MRVASLRFMHLSKTLLRLSLIGLLGFKAIEGIGAESLLIKNGLLITMKRGQEVPFVGYMSVGDDGRIVTVGKGDPPATVTAVRVVDAGGKFVAPGFISTHTHLSSMSSRGIGSDDNLYEWIQLQAPLWDLETADDVYWLTRQGAAECLRNGITTVYDFTKAGSIMKWTAAVGDKMPPIIIKVGPFEENQLKAKIDGGIRFVNSVSLIASGTDDEIIARFDKFLAYANATYGGNPLFLKTAISGAQQFMPTKDTALLEARVMKKYGVLNESHFLESPEHLTDQQAKFQWYADSGALGPNFIFGHFIHTTPEMIEAAAKAGASMSWQPMSNGRLGSGVADVVKYRAAGIKIGVGLDGGSCADTFDPFNSLRMGLYLVRAKYEKSSVLSAYDMLYMHTLGGAEVLQVADKVGSLESGKFADFLIVDPRSPDLGPIHDPIGTYVLACGLRNLQQVYVGGKLVAEGPTLIGQDEAKINKEVYTIMARMLASPKAKANGLTYTEPYDGTTR